MHSTLALYYKLGIQKLLLYTLSKEAYHHTVFCILGIRVVQHSFTLAVSIAQ